MCYQSSTELCHTTLLVYISFLNHVVGLLFFSGTGISLFTTTNALFRNYSAECFVDGTPVETSLEPSNYGQNKAICAAFGLPDGVLHALTLSISVLPLNADQSSEIFSGFCFDYILVQPSPSMSLAGSNLFIDFMVDEGPSNLTPNSFNFVSRAFQGASGSTGWIFRSGSGFQTSNQGSQLNVSFTGTIYNSQALEFLCLITYN